MDKWKEDLATLFKERNSGFEHTKAHAKEFFDHTVANAFLALKQELQKYGQRAHIASTEKGDSILVVSDDGREFVYSIEAEVFRTTFASFLNRRTTLGAS